MGMKNKGFTLIELLGVIIILALLMILVLPSVINSVKKSSKKTDDLTYELIYKAADLYISNHQDYFPKVNGNKYVIALNDLIADDLLMNPIKLTGSDEDLTNTKCVQVTYNNSYNYELKDSSECEENKNFCFVTSIQEDDTLIITDYVESCGPNVVIPSTIDGKTVTVIGSKVFIDNQLTSVVIPASIKEIGVRAFYENKLKTLEIPNGVERIRSYAFSYNRLTSVTISSSVMIIQPAAFDHNQITTFIINGKQNELDFESYWGPIGWADGLTDDNIIWNP